MGRMRAARWFLAVWMITATARTIARPTEESEFLAATVLGEEIAIWLEKLEPLPRSVSLFSVHPNPPLENDYGAIVETEVVKNVRERRNIHISSCLDCRVPQITVRDERLVVAKGAPDLERLRQLGKKEGVEAFAMLEIYRTKLSVIVQANVYQVGSGEIIGAERFRVPALNLGDSAAQLMVAWGPGITLGASGDDLPSALSFSVLEELGFGKGGLNLEGIFGAAGVGNLYALEPTLGFRGRFGSSAVTYLASVGGGYGFSDAKKGIAMRGAFDVFIGSFTLVGFDLTYLIPLKDAGWGISGFAGFHIGLSIGR